MSGTDNAHVTGPVRFVGDEDPAVLARIEACQEIGQAILREVAALCDRHGIPVYLDAGTLLGAFRHGGWIPWDDDIDLLMFRSDYERFRQVSHELPADLHLTDAETGNDHATQVPRVGYRLSGFEWAERLGIRPPERQRIVVDIFLIDNDLTGRLARRLRVALATALAAAVAMRATSPKRILAAEQRRPDQVLGLLLYIGAHVLPRAWLQRSYLAVATAGSAGSTNVIVLNHDRSTRGNSLRRSAFGENSVRLAFEGTEYLAPAPEEYLSSHFGDSFRQLPPLSARRPHPVEGFWAEFRGQRWGCPP